MGRLGTEAEELEHTLCEGLRANLAREGLETVAVSEDRTDITCRSEGHHWEARRCLSGSQLSCLIQMAMRSFSSRVLNL